MRFALDAKCFSPKMGCSVVDLEPLNKSGTNNDPKATPPNPKAAFLKKCRLFILILCSKTSFFHDLGFDNGFFHVVHGMNYLH